MSSLSNEGDRDDLLANPEFLEFDGAHVREGRTRVVEAERHIVGFATTIANGSSLELDDLFVDPAWMRRGVGRQLVADALDWARVSGYTALEVTANPHAFDFYREVGFVGDTQVTTDLGAGLRLQCEVRHD